MKPQEKHGLQRKRPKAEKVRLRRLETGEETVAMTFRRVRVSIAKRLGAYAASEYASTEWALDKALDLGLAGIEGNSLRAAPTPVLEPGLRKVYRATLEPPTPRRVEVENVTFPKCKFCGEELPPQAVKAHEENCAATLGDPERIVTFAKREVDDEE